MIIIGVSTKGKINRDIVYRLDTDSTSTELELKSSSRRISSKLAR